MHFGHPSDPQLQLHPTLSSPTLGIGFPPSRTSISSIDTTDAGAPAGSGGGCADPSRPIIHPVGSLPGNVVTHLASGRDHQVSRWCPGYPASISPSAVATR
jgi:hypothetical protein